MFLHHEKWFTPALEGVGSAAETVFDKVLKPTGNWIGGAAEDVYVYAPVMIEAAPGIFAESSVIIANEMSFGTLEKVVPGVTEMRESWQRTAPAWTVRFAQISSRVGTLCFAAAGAIAAAPAIGTGATYVWNGATWVACTAVYGTYALANSPAGQFMFGLGHGFVEGFASAGNDPPSAGYYRAGPYGLGYRAAYPLGSIIGKVKG